ncbi:hypothetical protein HELRODRAFT_105479 [Helobdella robusta]|uniref:Protein-S-isoprenylcysteine O-methyltransferase n=1 Tax=Helobdella robusta TaxID=6412 RepID=T1EDV4_HELRO|nr:hypothetical protein HELRODRAFT_105479 [Helobdella robusta]ESO12688.1 hypothetical protein HELRODRAFT_105479 [Helobdella robusta]
MACTPSLMSFATFCSGLLICLIDLSSDSDQFIYISFLYVLIFCSIIKFFFNSTNFQISLRSYMLGSAFSYGIMLAFSDMSLRLCGWYIAALAFFHWSEYFATSITNPQNLNLDSFLLNHSREYHLAVVASFIEYVLEWMVIPYLSLPHIYSYIGLTMVVAGEILRKGAMFNAGSNFNHYIRDRRENDHQLVTTGLYAIFRHPSYVGWMCWSVGTQVMIGNPACTVLYFIFTWFFFRERVAAEEYTLYKFFGSSYAEYKRNVPSGLPFIYGYDPQ